MSRGTVGYYRRHDDFRRYAASNGARVADLTKLYNSSKRYFGHRILDLACGGGVLGFVAEPRGHSYFGVDINPDMVNSARLHAKEMRSRNRFILGDIASVKLGGVFDTITLLGNALIHFNSAEFEDILRNIEGNTHSGTFFLVDYRDVVEMLFTGRWGRRYAQKRGEKTVVSLRKGINLERGEILIESRVSGKHNLNFGHAIWSPFIIEPIMNARNWKLARRRPVPAWSGWLDVYRKERVHCEFEPKPYIEPLE